MSGFYTGYKTDSGKDLIFIHKGSLDMVSLETVNRRFPQVRTKPPFDSKFVKVVKGVPFLYQKFPVPCGGCIGCKMTKARQWAIRCSLEGLMHDENIFITLTFNDEHYPKDPQELKPILQKFMKRLRFACGDDIRFFACCEKGETYGRFHYHLILFNCHIPDLAFFQMNGNKPYYRSLLVEKLWPFGFSYIGEANDANMSYVCRYVEKKQSDNPDPNEFILMSRRPGIGAPWFEAHKEELRKHFKVYGNFAHDGTYPPRYFDSKMEKEYPDVFAAIKDKRMELGELFDAFWMYQHHTSGEDAGFLKDRLAMKKKKNRKVL